MTPLYWLAWSTSRMLFRNLFRCRVYHPERMPLTGPVIIAANHESYLDPPFVGSSFHRPINYLARENLFSNWLSGPFLSSLNAVPVDRGGGGAKGLKSILERLMDNNAIIIFPEGTRTHDGKIKSAQAGIGLTIIKSRAPVVPVRLWTYKCLRSTSSHAQIGADRCEVWPPNPLSLAARKSRNLPAPGVAHPLSTGDRRNHGGHRKPAPDHGRCLTRLAKRLT